MKRKDFIKDVKLTAKFAKDDGQSVIIDYRLGTVSVDTIDSQYLFQGQEGTELIDSVPDDLNDQDYILFIAQGW